MGFLQYFKMESKIQVEAHTVFHVKGKSIFETSEIVLLCNVLVVYEVVMIFCY